MQELNSLCKYKNVFGEAGKKTGIRKYRIFGIAIFDVLVVLICAYFIARVFQLPFRSTLIVFFLLGILVHRLFCVKTTVDIAIFGK